MSPREYEQALEQIIEQSLLSEAEAKECASYLLGDFERFARGETPNFWAQFPLDNPNEVSILKAFLLEIRGVRVDDLSELPKTIYPGNSNGALLVTERLAQDENSAETILLSGHFLESLSLAPSAEA